jgi:hypothetical protein
MLGSKQGQDKMSGKMVGKLLGPSIASILASKFSKMEELLLSSLPERNVSAY